MRRLEDGIRGWRPKAKGELVTGIVGGDITGIEGNGAAVIWLTGMVGDGMVGVGGFEGYDGCALPGIIHSNGLKVDVWDV